MSALFHSLARTMHICMALVCIFAIWHSAAVANTAKVISVIPGVQSELDNKRTDIKLKDDIPIASTLYSDATGKARLVLPDTTCVNIAPDTELTLADFVDTEKEQNILINMVNGTAKIVTGEINRRNPDAFKITTPHASLAIRGTMAVVQVKGNATHVHLSETSGKGVVATNLATGKSVTIRKPGTMVIITPQGIERRDSTYEELRELHGMLRHRGIGVVPTERGVSKERETKLLPEFVASNNGMEFATTDLVQQGLHTNLLAGRYADPAGADKFSFNVNADAAITDGQFYKYGDDYFICTGRNGTGQIRSDGAFAIDFADTNVATLGGPWVPGPDVIGKPSASASGNFDSPNGGSYNVQLFLPGGYYSFPPFPTPEGTLTLAGRGGPDDEQINVSSGTFVKQ